jgi:hypothetical protein
LSIKTTEENPNSNKQIKFLHFSKPIQSSILSKKKQYSIKEKKLHTLSQNNQSNT